MTPLLVVETIAKRFGGVVAVDDVSFTVAAGERVALIGPNGAGKSTCFNMVGGQLRPDRGRVSLGGATLGGDPRAIWRQGVGRTFQIPETFGSMTVIEAVETALLAHRGRMFSLLLDAACVCRADAMTLIDRLSLGALAGRPCGELAYGDVKRVELALALAPGPKLLLMDEPTAGMAPGERRALMDLVSLLVEERGLAVLFTEHDMDIVFGHADRVLVLDHGRLIAQGDPASVRADPRVRSVYLGAEATP